MKLNRPYFYIILFAAVLITLSGFDFNDHGSFKWFDNIMQSAIITLFFIIFTDKSYKKDSNENSDQT